MPVIRPNGENAGHEIPLPDTLRRFVPSRAILTPGSLGSMLSGKRKQLHTLLKSLSSIALSDKPRARQLFWWSSSKLNDWSIMRL